MNSKIFFRRMTAVWTVKTQRKCISSHLHVENGSLGQYDTNSSASKMCFVTAMFAHMFIRFIIQNHFHLLFSIWNSLSDVLSALLFVAAVSIHLCCLHHWISSRRSSLLRIFQCQIFPCEDWQFGVLVFAVLFAWEIAWDLPIVNIVLQTMKRQLFMSALVIDGNSKSLSVECCLETKMRCDVTYCMTSWRTPSDIYK